MRQGHLKRFPLAFLAVAAGCHGEVPTLPEQPAGPAVASLSAAEYSLEALPLPSGFTSGRAIGVSGGGSAVGWVGYTTPIEGVVRPALWEDGGVTILPMPAGMTHAEASDISSDGRFIVGGTQTPWARILRWRNGAVEDLGSPYPLADCDVTQHTVVGGGPQINADGDVVVNCTLSQNDQAFVYRHGTWEQVLPAAQYSSGYDINDRGVIVGDFGSATESGGYAWRAGERIEVWSDYSPIGINARGQVLSRYPRGILTRGEFEPLPVLLVAPRAIASDGTVLDRGSVWRHGERVILPGSCTARALSSQSLVVGWCNQAVPVIWRRG